ncbi:hypothetical protein BJX64DRAFT_256706 [Aspergillus heterothallicus]
MIWPVSTIYMCVCVLGITEWISATILICCRRQFLVFLMVSYSNWWLAGLEDVSATRSLFRLGTLHRITKHCLNILCHCVLSEVIQI